MARYIELNQEKITRLKREAQQFQDDIVCSIGTDFMQKIAEAENRMIFDILNGLESEPTADVVPKNEVVRKIFDEIDNNYADFLFDGHRNIIALTEKDYNELKKKYTEESENDR